MKKLLTGIFFTVSIFANATSLRDVRLMLTQGPVRYNETENRVEDTVVVYGDGMVVGFRCNTDLSETCIKKQVGRISHKSLRKIDRQIERAERAEIRYPRPGDVLCAAMPVEDFDYSADNTSVLLKVGSRPCGGTTVRMGDDAAELVKILDTYMNRFLMTVGAPK